MKIIIRSFLLVILILFLFLPMTACRIKPTTSGSQTTQTTASSASTASTKATPTSGATTTTTTGQTTASPTTSGSGTAETTTTTTAEPLPDLRYQPLAADRNQPFDLNSDGVPEDIFYNVVDDFSFNITLNQQNLTFDGEMFLPDWFFLVDLDVSDTSLDVAIQELGPSDDYQVTFLYYDGSGLIKRGTVPGMICDIFSETLESDPYGTGTIHLDGKGGLTARARGQVLHTWFYDEPWYLAGNGGLKKIGLDYYAMQGYDPDTGELLPDTPVTLKINLPLFASPGSAVQSGIAKAGESASLTRTDNQSWVELRTIDGTLGWFQLVDEFRVLVNGSKYFGDEVFDGLSYAD